jgi:adenine-specific DNA methylase
MSQVPTLVSRPSLFQIVEGLQSCFNKVASCFEQTRQYLLAEVSYYENLQKNAEQITSALDIPSPGSFLDTDISQQPMGRIFIVIRDLYEQMGSEFTKQTIPSLHEAIDQVGKTSSSFGAFQKGVTDDLRRLVKQYEAETDQLLKWKRQMTTVSVFSESMFEFGQKSHVITNRFLEHLSSTERETMEELTKC